MKKMKKVTMVILSVVLMASMGTSVGAKATTKQVSKSKAIENSKNSSEITATYASDFLEAEDISLDIEVEYTSGYRTNDRMVKVIVPKDGMLDLMLFDDEGWNLSKKITIYDSNRKAIAKSWKENKCQCYRKTHVKAGEIFYIKLPKHDTSIMVCASVIKDRIKSKKTYVDSCVQGIGKDITEITLKEPSSIQLGINPVIPSGGKVTGVMQQKVKGKWQNFEKTFTIDKEWEGRSYGFNKGSYRFILTMPKEQAVIWNYNEIGFPSRTKSYGKKRSKAKALALRRVRTSHTSYYIREEVNLFTRTDRATRWYKFKQKKNERGVVELSFFGNSGKVKVKLYKPGKKKAFKTMTVKADNEDKRYTLPKGKGTYYMQLSKVGTKTNGDYILSVY